MFSPPIAIGGSPASSLGRFDGVSCKCAVPDGSTRRRSTRGESPERVHRVKHAGHLRVRPVQVVPASVVLGARLQSQEGRTSRPICRYCPFGWAGLIGCLRWAIELGRADIATEVSLLSRHLALPRQGHLDEALNIVAYLDKIKNSKLVMKSEPMGFLKDERLSSRFNKDADWFEFYGDVQEEVPSDAPTPLGKPVEINAWVDADHAGDRLTRRSHTGILIFVQSAPIFWYSKRQATIESSTFGSEIVAMRTCLEFVKDLRYKLRMMGVPLDGPAVVWCDNKSVANGASMPEAKLNKKHLGICYHAVREASAAKIWMVGFTHGKFNIADMLTKILSGVKKDAQAEKWMYRR